MIDSISLCVFYVMFVVFFKQKTAYELRISDWSSDVCSSDLTGFFRLLHAPVEPLPWGLLLIQAAQMPFHYAPSVMSCKISFLWEIGRASCRERVCQYV